MTPLNVREASKECTISTTDSVRNSLATEVPLWKYCQSSRPNPSSSRRPCPCYECLAPACRVTALLWRQSWTLGDSVFRVHFAYWGFFTIFFFIACGVRVTKCLSEWNTHTLWRTCDFRSWRAKDDRVRSSFLHWFLTELNNRFLLLTFSICRENTHPPNGMWPRKLQHEWKLIFI